VVIAPKFFVPAATIDNQEEVFESFAKWCNQVVPAPNRRLYSITYVHDGIEWIATVGERLTGERHRITRSKGKKIERREPVSDPAIVLAIFPGDPYFVITNQYLNGNNGSRWENPFMAGRPKSATYFEPDFAINC
jgi:hypothetical protein